jgi:hypothetical protein
MRTVSVTAALLSLMVGLCLLEYGQAQVVKRESDDTWAMQVKISFDKEVYFSGEEIAVTISVTNPLDRDANIIEPFTPQGGNLHPLRKGSNGGWSPFLDHPYFGCTECSGAIVTLRSKEVRTFTFRTSEGCGNGRLQFVPYCPMALDPGDYAYEYLYGSHGIASFTIKAATLIEMQVVRHRTTIKVRKLDHNYQPTGKFDEHPKEDGAFILESEGIRYVAISTVAHAGFSPIPPMAILRRPFSDRAAWYRILDETPEEIRNLRFTADDEENFSVTYDRGSERGHKLQLDSTRKLIGAVK